MGTDTPQHGSHDPLAPGGHVGFPPRSNFVLLPRRPARAARAGLALYEAVESQQRFAAAAGDVLTRVGLAGVFGAADRPEVDRGWWRAFFTDVVEPLVGRVARCAFRVPDNPRVSALAMDGRGRPIAFAKLLNTATPALTAAVSDLLTATPTRSFGVPATLAEGHFQGWDYRLLEPLPEGLHRPPPHDPATLWALVDEFHERVAVLSRPDDVPAHHVLCHADLTPRNVRVARDGRWYLFDWDNARWGPKLSDELRFWCAWFAYRRRPDVDRDAPRIHALLRQRGTEEDVQEAVAWPGRVVQTYREVEHPLLAAVGEVGR